jgi:hypothetical protein
MNVPGDRTGPASGLQILLRARLFAHGDQENDPVG